MGNITVYFKDEPYLGDPDYHHEYIVWTADDNKTKWFIRGGPASRTDFGPGSGGGSGASGSASPKAGANLPFGSILVTHDRYDLQAKDYAPPGHDQGDIIITGPDSELKPYYDRMVAEGNKINSEDIPYAPGGPNSNSVVTTLLKSVGLPVPTDNGLDGPKAAPGADMNLDNGQYSEKRGYRELLDNVFERGLHDIERGFVGPNGELPASHESPRAAEDGFRSPVAKVRAAAATARGAYAAKQASENAGDLMRALRANVMALARSKPISVAPVSRAKQGARSPFFNPHHAAEEAFPDTIRRLVHDRPGYATRQVQSAVARAVAPAGAEGEAPPDAVSSASNPAMNAASIVTTARLGQGYAVLGQPHPGSVIAMASELRKALGANKPWITGRRNSGAASTGFLVNRQVASPSIAPIGRQGRDDISVEQFTSHHFDPAAPAERKYSAPIAGADKKIDQLALRGALEELLERQSRLPPSGASAFDPLLTPAWPGLQLPA